MDLALVRLNRHLKKYGTQVLLSERGYTVSGVAGMKLFPLLWDELEVRTVANMLRNEDFKRIMVIARGIDNGATV